MIKCGTQSTFVFSADHVELVTAQKTSFLITMIHVWEDLYNAKKNRNGCKLLLHASQDYDMFHCCSSSTSCISLHAAQHNHDVTTCSKKSMSGSRSGLLPPIMQRSNSEQSDELPVVSMQNCCTCTYQAAPMVVARSAMILSNSHTPSPLPTRRS